MITTRSRSPLYVPLLLAVCGILFSVWNAQDAASVPCVSAGCTLYQSFTVNGYSLWWGGVGIFTALALLAATGHAAPGRWLSGLAVLLDCVLLGIMALTLPCMACMGAALLLALSYWAFRAASPDRRGGTLTRPSSPLLIVWGLLFIVNIGGLVRGEVRPWAIQSPGVEDEAVARVFFSPSCSACRQLVMGMSEADARRVVWCPVAEEERDLAIILNMKHRMELADTPLNRAFLPALETPALGVWDMLHPDVLLTQFRLWCNQARVISSSEGRLPLVEFMGVPSALLKPHAPAPSPAAPAPARPSEPMFGGQSPLPGQSSTPDQGLPFDMGITGSCGGPNAVPCP